jgi:hypothetical protein
MQRQSLSGNKAMRSPGVETCWPAVPGHQRANAFTIDCPLWTFGPIEQGSGRFLNHLNVSRKFKVSSERQNRKARGGDESNIIITSIGRQKCGAWALCASKHMIDRIQFEMRDTAEVLINISICLTEAKRFPQRGSRHADRFRLKTLSSAPYRSRALPIFACWGSTAAAPERRCNSKSERVSRARLPCEPSPDAISQSRSFPSRHCTHSTGYLI